MTPIAVVRDTHTYNNPKGLVSICRRNSIDACAILGVEIGSVVVHCDNFRKVVRLSAHRAPLASIALSPTGEYLATASETGTIIRVFNAKTGASMHEIKRGSASTEFYSIAFSHDACFLACTTAKETVHVFVTGKYH